jgi:multidrug efflux system membrane fusion protein
MRDTKIAFFVGIVLACLLNYCSREQQISAGENRIPVRVAEVQQKAISIPVRTSGLLSSKEQIRLSFKTGGIIEAVYAQEGETVSKGQLLAQLDLAEIKAQLSQAQSVLDKAQRDYHRIVNLYSDSAATLEQKQNVETALDVARSNLCIVDFNLAFSSIQAPTNGRILKRFSEPGELVSPGTPIFYFASDEGDWIVRASVIDRDVVKLAIGDSATVRFDAFPDRQFAAVLSEIASAADPLTGTFEVELTLAPDSARFASGLVADVFIYPSDKSLYYVLPVEALVEADGDTGYVYSIWGDSLKRVAVGISRFFESLIATDTNLKNVNRVVTEGSQYAKEGDRVVVTNE